MAIRAARDHITEPLIDPPTYRTRDFLIDGACVVFILITASVCGCLVADHVQGKIAHHCAVELQKAVQ
jgi:hypothetical protein